ncbi:hypothetical protein A3D05_04485 [Candidatus Gottesmanbacteria bacterium RIFCSPHIGHO2_02_FULL_40_24]|uniref:Glycosyltransferase 2-like domain-containing protein n=1 Tax=Candidatus Gottesmanbacteria bacterium RIFCSPHIGHO2_01_FULL_40_15 TaxID=1798376 RepID=A0A1F5Z1T3_9BACT|nr:MAG: hypothetical protein A2777_05515 [Candidatus Gottesmanbacteria bacterium RIFCSPHIGHO2_01_FULL_40_15]OGG16127.1 MAG: hypothetical protein A3D05_04485 [Candidatus Gottesmanbacteria bacterium RIFCSPHIGHO2_02_FULL_40_24]OGG20862.1 MAG: hypothetical protein A3B48_06650 [Candidatus Gottesmanbacteria bacterium RIFCSPLOWO2_01_FULL_40_10]OGG25797.1 MAG: hypothetical protein A3E42_05755 [Candidatus Gottesmanbacteria bacterium RIFCSPHIGHO2_12_FULL_40_13]OGG31703.1 MAG: hypothetical protein A3I80_0
MKKTDEAVIFLSVVIPCFNEERNIRLGALDSVSSYLTKQTFLWEVILVDDGSNDDSPYLLKKFVAENIGFRLVNIRHKGKAAAVSAGILKSKGKIILFTDLDQATPLKELKKLLPLLEKGNDLVIGSRNSNRKGAPITRLMMARGFMIIRNFILDLGIRDTQCGFKAFQKKAAFDIFSKLLVFNSNRLASGSTVTAGFDIELLYIAKIRGYKIAEVPVEWHYQETRNVNPVKDSLESLLDLVRIRINSLKGLYRA